MSTTDPVGVVMVVSGLRAEVARLRSMLEWCWQRASDGLDIDGGEFQLVAQSRGLLVAVPNHERQEYDFVLAWSEFAVAAAQTEEPT